MIARQPKIHVGLRMVAAGCIVLWLLVASHCSIEHLLVDDHHHADVGASEDFVHPDSGYSHEAKAEEHAQGEASHSHDSKQHSRDSHPQDGGDDSCCSTLMATAQIDETFVIAKRLLKPLSNLCTVLQARDPMLPSPRDNPQRQVKPRDWVFTPEVCLGPAHRSHAPPSLA